MGDTVAFAPAPTAGGLSGKRTFGSAPARGTGARRSSDGDGLDVGDALLVDGDGDGESDVALAVVLAVVVVETEDAADGPVPPLQPAANDTAATASAVSTNLT